MLAAIDFDGLGQVIWVSSVASVAVTVLFSIVIYGSIKSGDARRSGQSAEAFAFGALAVLAMVVFTAAVVLGVAVMLNKG